MTEYPESAARFKRETPGHEMVILHDEGLYRHLACTDPNGSFYRFDLITWPHNLMLRGDGFSFAFAIYPTRDMFDLFRETGSEGINPGYWQEKVTAGRGDIKGYSEELFKERVAKELKAAEEFFPGVTAAWQESVEGFYAKYNTEYEETAREALADFEYLPEGQFGEAWSFRYTDEWRLIDYSWEFLFACHAIAWGVDQYNAVKAASASAEAVAS
jgi:hypothetical protein